MNIIESNVKPSQNVESSHKGKIKKNSSAREARVALSPYEKKLPDAQLSSSEKTIVLKDLQSRQLQERYQELPKEILEELQQKKDIGEIKIKDLVGAHFVDLPSDHPLSKNFIIKVEDGRISFHPLPPKHSPVPVRIDEMSHKVFFSLTVGQKVGVEFVVDILEKEDQIDNFERIIRKVKTVTSLSINNLLTPVITYNQYQRVLWGNNKRELAKKS